MSIYKTTFSYDGSKYFGWQKQVDQRTIQGEIEKVLIKLSKSQDIQVVGCGRTDTGVHATCQITRLTMPINIGPEELRKALNSLLPLDIRAISCESCNEDFQPVYDAKLKTYRYLFSPKKDINPFLKDYVTYLGKELNLEKLREACVIFQGEHDFVGFSTKGTPVKTTVRKIKSCSVSEITLSYGAGLSEQVYLFEIKGSGFLKQMVRLIVSAVWSYAEGKISKGDIENQFTHPDASKLAPTAPPNGLYLHHVDYE